jgi:hypothetical protein
VSFSITVKKVLGKSLVKSILNSATNYQKLTKANNLLYTRRITMRKSIIVSIVLATIVACSVASVSAVEICMPVKIVQINPDYDGTNVIVVVNQDGDSFMFSDIKWKAKIGQKLYMCITLTYGKGNFWTMDETGDTEPFLSDKPKR